MRPTELKEITLNEELELILWDNQLVSVLTPDFEATATLTELYDAVLQLRAAQANFEFAQEANEEAARSDADADYQRRLHDDDCRRDAGL